MAARRTLPIEQVVAARRCGRHSWREIGALVGWNPEKARSAYRRRDGKQFPTETTPMPCPLCAEVSGRESMTFEERGNYAEATIVSSDVTTVDGALAFLESQGQDLSAWQVRDWEIKFWQVGAKIKEGHLHWTDGKIDDGELNYRGLGKEDLRSIWLRFIRRQPVAIQPTIQPMQAVKVWPAPEARPVGMASKTLIITDVHMGFRKRVRDAKLAPFHDRRVLDLAYQVAELERPDRVLFVGDTADLADWSGNFVKEPSFYFTTQPMIIELHWRLARFRQLLPVAEIIMHQGNHSERVPRAILVHLSAAYGLRAADELELPPQLSLPRLLALHDLGIEWIGGYPDDNFWLAEGVRSKHGNKSSAMPGATARKMLDSGVSTVYGHDHLKALVWGTMVAQEGPRPIFSYNCGCACHVDGRVPGHNKDQNWQQGFGLLEMAAENTQHGIVTITDAQVCEGRTVWRGQVLEARDDVEELRAAYPDWNW